MARWLLRGAVIAMLAILFAGCASGGSGAAAKKEASGDNHDWGCKPFCAGFSP
jgi:hypothetical protein